MANGLPSVARLVRELRNVRADCRVWGADWVDVRLQWLGADGWALRVGAACYDLDHLGWWGSSAVRAADTVAELRDTARGLLAECRDHRAQWEGGDHGKV